MVKLQKIEKCVQVQERMKVWLTGVTEDWAHRSVTKFVWHELSPSTRHKS